MILQHQLVNHDLFSKDDNAHRWHFQIAPRSICKESPFKLDLQKAGFKRVYTEESYRCHTDQKKTIVLFMDTCTGKKTKILVIRQMLHVFVIFFHKSGTIVLKITYELSRFLFTAMNALASF